MNTGYSFTVAISSVFNCSLERAFKTPMLCDIAKVHTGYGGVMPKITHSADDENWGKPGYSKKVFAARTLTFKGGEVSSDTVVERIENRYWKIEVGNFKTAMLGFDKFIGEWETTEIEPGKILVNYTYHLHAGSHLYYPLCWLFARVFWKRYMRQVMENIRRMAVASEPYLFD